MLLARAAGQIVEPRMWTPHGRGWTMRSDDDGFTVRVDGWRGRRDSVVGGEPRMDGMDGVHGRTVGFAVKVGGIRGQSRWNRRRSGRISS